MVAVTTALFYPWRPLCFIGGGDDRFFVGGGDDRFALLVAVTTAICVIGGGDNR